MYIYIFIVANSNELSGIRGHSLLAFSFKRWQRRHCLQCYCEYQMVCCVCVRLGLSILHQRIDDVMFANVQFHTSTSVAPGLCEKLSTQTPHSCHHQQNLKSFFCLTRTLLSLPPVGTNNQHDDENDNGPKKQQWNRFAGAQCTAFGPQWSK